jgi:hypothetical protein
MTLLHNYCAKLILLVIICIKEKEIYISWASVLTFTTKCMHPHVMCDYGGMNDLLGYDSPKNDIVLK